MSELVSQRMLRDGIVCDCLHRAYGEPGYAVQLIYEEIDDQMERRKAVNRLWFLLGALESEDHGRPN